MENIIVASSNLNGIFAIHNYYKRCQYKQSVAICCAMLASIVYHLIEHHKHNMLGIGIFKNKFYHVVFLNLDRFFAFYAVYMSYSPKIFKHIYFALFGLTCLFTSEILSTLFSPSKEKLIHIIFHCLWHLSAFEMARLLSISK